MSLLLYQTLPKGDKKVDVLGGCGTPPTQVPDLPTAMCKKGKKTPFNPTNRKSNKSTPAPAPKPKQRVAEVALSHAVARKVVVVLEAVMVLHTIG